MNEHKIRQWLVARFQDDPPCVKVTLMHVSEMGPEIVGTYRVGAGSENLDTEVLRISEAIRIEASDHVEAFEGKQRFRICAIDEEGQELANHTFVIEGSPSTSLDLVPERFEPGDEPPTTEGLLAQLMRHVERKEQLNTRLTESMVGHLISENQDLRLNREKYHQLHLKEIELVESLYSEQHQRDLETEEHQAALEMKKQALNTALRFAPHVVGPIINKIVDKEIIPIAKIPHQANGKSVPVLEEHAKKMGLSEEPKNGDATVAAFQDHLRGIVKVIGGSSVVKEGVEEERHSDLDDLLGVGVDPSDVETYRKKFSDFIECLPEELFSKLQEEISDEQKLALAAIAGI